MLGWAEWNRKEILTLRFSVERVSDRTWQHVIDLDHLHSRLDVPDVHQTDASREDIQGSSLHTDGGNDQGLGVGLTSKHLGDPIVFVFAFRHRQEP